MRQYSFLVTVYRKEKPDWLRQSLESVFAQTLPSNDVVLICDGPLTEQLDAVIAEFQSKYPDVFRVVRLPKNMGAGPARNRGLQECKNEYIAIQDSDDISLPDRCRLQMKRLEECPELAVLGGQMSEFLYDLDHVVAVKQVPTDYQQLYRYAKRRDPFNNNTVMIKKDAALALGGFPPLNRCEDYMLYALLLHNGYKGANLEEVVSAYRLTDDTYCRRGSMENVKGFIKVRWEIHKMGFSSLLDFGIPSAVQVLYSIMPLAVKKYLYQKVIRKAG